MNVEYPPCSPAFKPLDFCLWGYKKYQVYSTKPAPVDELTAATEREYAQTPNHVIPDAGDSTALCRKQCLDQTVLGFKPGIDNTKTIISFLQVLLNFENKPYGNEHCLHNHSKCVDIVEGHPGFPFLAPSVLRMKAASCSCYSPVASLSGLGTPRPHPPLDRITQPCF